MFYNEPRSKDWYDCDDDGSSAAETPLTWSGILLFPVHLVLVILIMALISVLPLLLLIGYGLSTLYKGVRAKIRNPKPADLALVLAAILLAALWAIGLFYKPSNLPSAVVPLSSTARATTEAARHPSSTSTPMPTVLPALTRSAQVFPIVVEDFDQLPVQGQPMFFFNRLEGDRGALNNSKLDWGRGQVTATIAAKSTWGGGWLSPNHPIREGLAINFGAILPPQILPPYQSRISGLSARIVRGTPGRIFRLELKEHGAFSWTGEIVLTGGAQVARFDLPALGPITELVWVLDHAAPGDFVVLDSIAFTATTQIVDTATASFVWGLAQLLDNADPASGLVRDKARDASGEFDAVPATGGLAAATALAAQLGIISHEDAIQIVSRIADTLLNDLPRFGGLWPHWVKTAASGKPIIVPGTEYSSVDSVTAAISLLTAQQALGLDTSGTEAMIRDIGWSKLVTLRGISHGYTDAGKLIPYAWDSFSGEAFLVELAYASATGRVAPMAYPSPPTFNGSGFLDELAFLWAPPPSGLDVWGNDWRAYRSAAAETQIAYFRTHYPTSCLARFGVFGLSAAEGTDPSRVSPADLYQAVGVGGRFKGPNDGSALWGAPIAVPHYAAMIASLRPKEATAMWDWLIRNGLFTPLSNVESLMFPRDALCDADGVVYNSLKGSWNELLATLGWGTHLAQRRGEVSILWQAVTANAFLAKGYGLLAPDGPALALTPAPTATPVALLQAPLTPFAIYTPPASETPITPQTDVSLTACKGQPLYQWKLLGRFESADGGSAQGALPELPSAPTVSQCPDMSSGWRYGTQSFGERLSELPVSGTERSWGCSGSSGVRIRIVGTEVVTTTRGIFQAIKVNGSQGYAIDAIWTPTRGLVKGVKDMYYASEWWVCGYGLVRLSAAHEYNDGVFPGSTQNAEQTFVAAMPFAYYESTVRVILADMQLAGSMETYRARASEADVREALRRWDAGMRVVNLSRFERRAMTGQWQIVYAGTESPINGADVIVYTDSKE